MQTTLLGLAIAFILALVAALVGPLVVDWGRYRPQFEAEASRLIGAPVRITGSIEARILPTPALILRGHRNRPPGASSGVRARSLAVELALGSLVRGRMACAGTAPGRARVQFRDGRGRRPDRLAERAVGFDPGPLVDRTA